MIARFFNNFDFIQSKVICTSKIITSGNISVQLEKLSSAGYIQVNKEFIGKKTRTSCRMTEEGKRAFEEYVETLKTYLKL